MTQTEHYQLNQWSASDRVHHDDFNEDNRKIDAALAGKAPARELLNKTVVPGAFDSVFFWFGTGSDINWDDWEYVIMQAELKIPLKDENDKIELITQPTPETLVTFNVSSFLLILFPMHDKTRKISGLVLGDGASYFTAETVYEAMNQLQVVWHGTFSHKPQDIQSFVFGIK